MSDTNADSTDSEQTTDNNDSSASSGSSDKIEEKVQPIEELPNVGKNVTEEVTKETSKNFSKITDNLLKESGIDAHELKKDFLGNKAQISSYDLYKETKTGEILILQKGGKGTPIRTGEFIK